jgi:hypothetical protein
MSCVICPTEYTVFLRFELIDTTLQRTNTKNWKQIFAEKEYINGIFLVTICLCTRPQVAFIFNWEETLRMDLLWVVCQSSDWQAPPTSAYLHTVQSCAYLTAHCRYRALSALQGIYWKRHTHFFVVVSLDPSSPSFLA